jgi:hypothetical protein
MVTIVNLDRPLSLLDLDLTKAHRSCVDGDGAYSNPFTQDRSHAADDFADLPDLVAWFPPAGVNPYVALVAEPILSVQYVYTKNIFRSSNYPIHLRVMADDSDEELINQMVSSKTTPQFLIDTGATCSLAIHNSAHSIIGMLVSKIVPDESRFIVFGGADSGLKSLGWGWVRYKKKPHLVKLFILDFYFLAPISRNLNFFQEAAEVSRVLLFAFVLTHIP